MPSADTSMPPHQQQAETTPALRGPTRSSQPPHTAAAHPRKTKKSVYIQPRVERRQSQPVANISARKLMPGAHVCAPLPLMESSFESGSQKTENPYAMPMHR